MKFSGSGPLSPFTLSVVVFFPSNLSSPPYSAGTAPAEALVCLFFRCSFEQLAAEVLAPAFLWDRFFIAPFPMPLIFGLRYPLNPRSFPLTFPWTGSLCLRSFSWSSPERAPAFFEGPSLPNLPPDCANRCTPHSSLSLPFLPPLVKSANRLLVASSCPLRFPPAWINLSIPPPPDSFGPLPSCIKRQVAAASLLIFRRWLWSNTSCVLRGPVPLKLRVLPPL